MAETEPLLQALAHRHPEVLSICVVVVVVPHLQVTFHCRRQRARTLEFPGLQTCGQALPLAGMPAAQKSDRMLRWAVEEVR